MTGQRQWSCALTVTCAECSMQVTFSDVGTGVAAVTNGLFAAGRPVALLSWLDPGVAGEAADVCAGEG